MNLGTLALAWMSPILAGMGDAPVFERVVIDEHPPTNPWVKIVADLDGDGRDDVVVGGSKGPLVWYENPTWTRRPIAEAGYSTVDGEAADLDGDGDLDLVLGGVVWYENPRPGRGPASGPWTMHRIDDYPSHDIEVGDLDGDGDLDVVTRDQSLFGHQRGNRIVVYRQDTPTAWTRREIACPHGEGLKLGDLDGDGDLDIVIAARWYENTGDPAGGAWTERILSESWTHTDAEVEIGDLNGDHRPDMVLTPAEGSYRISWFDAPAAPTCTGWTEHVIVPATEFCHSLQLGDLDGDGVLDVATARMHQSADPDEVTVLLNRGRGASWDPVVVSNRGSHDILARDLDGDGRIDLVGANHGGPYSPLELWRNRAATRADAPPATP